jgi:hypothetical protein
LGGGEHGSDPIRRRDSQGTDCARTCATKPEWIRSCRAGIS